MTLKISHVIWVAALAAGVFWFVDRRSKNIARDAIAAAEAAAQCEKESDCYNRPTLVNSIFESKPVRGPKGEWFFRGEQCEADCSQVVSGYEWAETAAVDYAWDCAGDSREFRMGCHMYLEEQRDMSEECSAYMESAESGGEYEF